ncbi:MAG: hypothetical protein DPW09_22640 [Anaerolineae bacterium]|nr:hypothetical protein [Anaerolineales bacterium]MCQ3976236.1 hypothetical protein [Anaerolineae bacterium]
MSKINRYVFVLWGERFEEAAAAIFVTELRKAGLLVKLVGLDSGHLSGANGLKLLPDLTLGQALLRATQAICVIFPCRSADIQPFNHDPRLREFIGQAQASGARFIIKSAAELEDFELGLCPMVYPEGEALLEFAAELAQVLSAMQ